MGNSEEEGVRIEELGYTGDLPFLFEDLNCKCFSRCVCDLLANPISPVVMLLSDNFSFITKPLSKTNLILSGLMARCRLFSTLQPL